MFGFIRKISHKRETKKLFKSVTSSLTLEGIGLELKSGTLVSLIEGSVKDDILLKNRVALRGCVLCSAHHGKIELGNYVKLGNGTRINSVNSVKIGDYTAVADDVIITDNNNHPINPEFRKFMRTTSHRSDARSWIHSDNKPIIIGSNCWIGANVRIQKGVTIGDNSIIAACSVVTKDVPANCIAAGNPAKIVKTDIDKIPAPNSCKEFNDFMANN